jgi:arsenate reductase (thioredoxin)
MRVQLALNVTNLTEAIDFYSTMFGTAPYKVKSGYANWAIENPPLKLVIFENPNAEPGSINHLGVETDSAEEVVATEARLTGAGLTTTGIDDTICCFAEKVETWVEGPTGHRWEWYVKQADHDTQLTNVIVSSSKPAATAAPFTESKTPSVLFLCVHNAGRSQMAAGFMRSLSQGAINVLSAGSNPGAALNPMAIEAMHEVGIDITAATPQRWTTEMLQETDVIVSMGCGDECPVYPGTTTVEWALEDPAGQDLAFVRTVRDQIEQQVRALIAELLALQQPKAPEQPKTMCCG